MNRMQIEKLVSEFLIKEFEIEENIITNDAHLIADIGLESLDLVDIVVTIENEFGFKVKREDLKDIRTLEDLYSYIETSISEK